MTDLWNTQSSEKHAMTDLWSTQSGEKQRVDLAKVRLPRCAMADVPVEDLPAALVSLRAVADCIYGMCFQGEPERDLRTALRVMEYAQADLDDARTAVEAALSRAEERSE